MAASNINRVVLTGNLTADPELRSIGNGTPVCKLRLAVNTRRKNSHTQEWEDKPNYFSITVWGKQGENAAKYLAKGRPVAIDGRLEWSEYPERDSNGNETGRKRQSIDVIADTVQFLSSPQGADGGGYGNGFQAPADVPTDTSDFNAPATPAGGAPMQQQPPAPMQPVSAPPPADDDIPF